MLFCALQENHSEAVTLLHNLLLIEYQGTSTWTHPTKVSLEFKYPQKGGNKLAEFPEKLRRMTS